MKDKELRVRIDKLEADYRLRRLEGQVADLQRNLSAAEKLLNDIMNYDVKQRWDVGDHFTTRLPWFRLTTAKPVAKP